MYKKLVAMMTAAMLAMAMAGALTGCGGGSTSSSAASSSGEAAQEASDSAAIEVEIAVEPMDAGGKTAFQIATNLPDETELMLTLDGKTVSYTGQTKVAVADGAAISEGFGKDGGALPSGDYTLTVSMSLPRLQSDAVRAAIGEKGENITGQYVEASDIGGENVVHAEFPITL